jgi:HD superfamily phosphohydrolase
MEKIWWNLLVFKSIPIDLTEDFKLAQFTTILHDISHLRFSHALDKQFPLIMKNILLDIAKNIATL